MTTATATNRCGAPSPACTADRGPGWLRLTTGGRSSLCDPEHHVDLYELGGSLLAVALRQTLREPSDIGAWLALYVSIEAVREGCRRMGIVVPR